QPGDAARRGHVVTAPVRVTPATRADGAALAALVEGPSLREHFRHLRDSGVERIFDDPYGHVALRHLAWVGDAPAGFTFGGVVPGHEERWAHIAIGVAEPFRRRGVGRALLARATASVRADAGLADVRTMTAGSFHPDPAAER